MLLLEKTIRQNWQLFSRKPLISFKC